MEYSEAKVKDIFVEFFKGYKDERNELKYRIQISQLPAKGAKSVVVDYPDLQRYDTDLATSLVKEPDLFLKAFDGAAVETLNVENPTYADKILKELHVRLRELPDRISLRSVTKEQLNSLILVAGMVTRTSELRPLAVTAAFRCSNGHFTYIEQTGSGSVLKRPIKCETEGCGETRNFELDERKTEFIDFQVIKIQEMPEELPPGQLPQSFDVNMTGDLVNTARPGDRIVLTGIVKAESENVGGTSRKLFSTRIEANFNEQLGKRPEEQEISREEEDEIKALAAMPAAYDRLISSVAPAIFGHELHKEAALLLMVGSPQKSLPDGSTLRGDINILLVGDPGTAKSELLKYVARVAPRGLFTSGRGSTAAGLTAAVVKEKNGMMMLEAGATVLADLGVACITEDTEIYDGQRLVSVTKLWHSIDTPVYITKTGREAKSLMFPVSIYDKSARADLLGMAYSLMRRRFAGDVVKLTLSSGLNLRVTPEHLLRRLTNVKNLWIRADEVVPGDELRSPVRLFRPSTCLDISPEDGYVIGCIYGDGWFGKSNITISQAKVNEDVVSAIQDRLPSVFARYDKGERYRALGNYILVSRMYQLYTTDSDLIRKTRFLLKNPSTDNVLLLQDKALWSFIAGVFDTDGDLNHVKGTIVAARLYPTKSEHELRVMMYALRRLGIYARIRGFNKSIPIIQISGADISRFIEGIREFSIKLKRNGDFVIRHKGERSLKRGVERVVKVVREKYDGYVYDLSVGKYHNYESSLIYVHNCIDEFDKMRDEDRSALHEVMEQQSYHPSFEISLADGRRVRIGDYVDRLLSYHKGSVIKGKDCEILQLADSPEIYSCDISIGRVKRVRVDRVSRHKSPESFVTIKYSNGRKITVTPDHPVFVYRDQSIKIVAANEISMLDYVPIPRVIPNSSVPVVLTMSLPPEHRSKAIILPKTLSPELARILGFLIAEGHFYAGSSHEIGFTNADVMLLTEVKELFGRVFHISPSVSTKDGVTIQRYISKTLFEWLSGNFPEIMQHARKKRAPQKILGSSVATIREFLASAFLGDGSQESTTISYRTASPGLAEDYQDLLHKLGIISRIVHDGYNDSFKVCIMGDSIPTFFDRLVEESDKRYERLKQFKLRSNRTLRGHDTLPPKVAVEIATLMRGTGMKRSNYFHEHVKRRFGVNRSVAEKYLANIDDVISRFEEFSRTNWSSLRSERRKLGISQQMLADICGKKRGLIAYLEAGGHKTDSEDILEQLKKSVEVYGESVREEYRRIRNLLEFRFLRVSDLSVVPNKGEWETEWVYDVTVEPNHNFISKGVILHNTASVAKGGIIATLNARTSILAAANPVDGKYDPYKNILDNVALPIPLLTRFDLIFIIRDDADPAQDETVARHILDMRARSSFPQAPPIEFDMLKKYIIYAKKLDPDFTEEASKRLSNYYIQLRRQTSPDQMSVTPRWLEGMIRLSIARARLLLHPRVSEDDALHAINLIERMLNTVAVDQATKKVDVGVLYNRPFSEKGLREAALDVFKRLSGESKQPVEDKAFYEEMEKTGKFTRDQAEKVFQDMWKSGVIFEVRAHFFKKA